MPNIKPELRGRVRNFIDTREGETLLVLTLGALFWAALTILFGTVSVFVSETLYPFTYQFFHTPLHAFLPREVSEPSFFGNLIFGSVFSFAIYRFEKNIFYRRFHLSLKAAFASIAACTFVFLSSTIAFLIDSIGLEILSIFLLEAEVKELPALFVFYYLASLPVFYLCDTIRRQVFLLP